MIRIMIQRVQGVNVSGKFQQIEDCTVVKYRIYRLRHKYVRALEVYLILDPVISMVQFPMTRLYIINVFATTSFLAYTSGCMRVSESRFIQR